jgi:hypothetical protein
MSDQGKGKGGSYPNYPSRMKYELPLPYAPLGPPSDAYRDGYERVFSESTVTTTHTFCPHCDLRLTWCECA